MARDSEAAEDTSKRHHSHVEAGRKRGRSPHRGPHLTKEDFDDYKEVFARYLKEKKNIRIEDLSSTETYARFKSFVHKWYFVHGILLNLGTMEACHPDITIPN